MLCRTSPTPSSSRRKVAALVSLMCGPTTSYGTLAARSTRSYGPPWVMTRTGAPRSRSARWISSMREVADRYPQCGTRQITATASFRNILPTNTGNILHMSPEQKPVFDLGADSGLEAPVRAFRLVLLLAQRLRYLMDDRLRP